MTKKKLVYDCFMSWPYHEPYGMVPAPKQEKAPRKRRKSRAKPEWLKQPRTQAAKFVPFETVGVGKSEFIPNPKE